MKRYKINAITKQGMFFILELTNGKTHIVDCTLVKSFQRISAANKFRVTMPATQGGFMQLNMYNCDFATNFYAVVKEG